MFVILQLQSCINLLRGRVYEAMDNQNLAAECFREALRLDVFCYEAFSSLIGHHLLTAQQGTLFISEYDSFQIEFMSLSGVFY